MFVSGDFRDKSRKVLKLQNFQKCTRAIYPKSPFQACNYYYKLSKYGDYKNKMHSYNFPASLTSCKYILKIMGFRKFKGISQKICETEWDYGSITEFLLVILQKLPSVDFLLLLIAR